MADDNKKVNFAETITELEDINKWFQGDDIDLDEGLTKLKRGKDLIKTARSRLTEVENEFVKIKDEFPEEEPTAEVEESVTNQPVTDHVTASTNPVNGDGEEVAPDDIPF